MTNAYEIDSQPLADETNMVLALVTGRLFKKKCLKTNSPGEKSAYRKFSSSILVSIHVVSDEAAQ